MIPQAKIDAIKESVSLLEIAAEHTKLKRRGTSHVGLCPFHAERTPSFAVSNRDEREFFHCFGCGAGGDVIAFVQKIENVGFEFAVRTLAKRAGIEIEDAPFGNTEAEAIYSANEFAAKFFQRNLSASAREYLLGRLSADTIEKFGLGCAGDGWHSLRDALQEKGFSEDVAVKAGLTRLGDRGAYDVFRGGRIMIPIRNEMGNIAGFAGRAMRREDEPLYVNTAENVVYRKGNILFGAWDARSLIRERGSVVLVEGYFDAMKLIERGYPAVAICGTALTPAQVDKISRMTSKCWIMLDGDKAGRAAAEKAGEMLARKVDSVRIVHLDDGVDPDDLSPSDLDIALVNSNLNSFQAFACRSWPLARCIEYAASMESVLGQRDMIEAIAAFFRLSTLRVESLLVGKMNKQQAQGRVVQYVRAAAGNSQLQDEIDMIYLARVKARADRVNEILKYKEALQ